MAKNQNFPNYPRSGLFTRALIDKERCRNVMAIADVDIDLFGGAFIIPPMSTKPFKLLNKICWTFRNTKSAFTTGASVIKFEAKFGTKLRLPSRKIPLNAQGSYVTSKALYCLSLSYTNLCTRLHQ